MSRVDSSPDDGGGGGEGRWEFLPAELFPVVLTKLVAARDVIPIAPVQEDAEYLRYFRYDRYQVLDRSATIRDSYITSRATHGAVRGVCRRWRASHDALLPWLRVSVRADDQSVIALVRRFPGLATVSCANCCKLTDEGVRVLGSLSALTSLNLKGCSSVTVGYHPCIFVALYLCSLVAYYLGFLSYS